MLFFFLVDSWAVATFVVVLTFDLPDDLFSLQYVLEKIQEAKLPYLKPPVHLATDEAADRVLAEFDKDGA